MVTTLGMFLSIFAMTAALVICLCILCNIIFWVDDHIDSNILILLTIIIGLIFICFAIGISKITVEDAFRKPVNIIVFDEQGEKICEYNEVEKADETRDGIEFEIDGRKHIIQNYSWEWSE